MNRLTRWLRDAWQRVRGIFYEGPDPPERIAQTVSVFATMHPNATVAEWMAFATEFGAGAYRDGWTRGYEWHERAMAMRDENDPAILYERMKNEKPWIESGPSAEQLARVVGENPYAHMSPEEQALALDSLGRYFGAVRVQAVDLRSNPKER